MDLRALVVLCLCGMVVSQSPQICPSNCLCYLDNKGRSAVECKQGGMVTLFTNISTNIEILKITAPEENMNTLSMSPSIQNYLQLEEIHITRSNIPNLGEHFFYGLTKLEVLNLAQNNITQILPINFYGMTKLKELYLDDNRIYSMPSETFRYLPELRMLSIQKNRIQEVMLGVFRGLSKLRVLKLNGNFVNALNPDIFKNIAELRVFECRGCSLKTIDPQVNKVIPLLVHLDYGENVIQEVKSSDLLDLTKLKILKLDGNNLNMIPDNILSNHTDMKKLILSKNNISKIEINAFQNLINLTDLDLAYNKIDHLESDVIDHVAESLEKLALSGNRIPLSELKELLENTNLKELQLSNVGLTEIDESFLPQSIEILNLAGNQLSYIPAYVLPTSLKDLDITGNLFRGLDTNVLDKVENVRCALENNPWSCDLCHIIPMLERANRSSAIYNVRCELPYHHANKILGSLQRDELSWCSAAGYSSEGANFFSSRDDGSLGIIAAGASVLLLLLTVLAIMAALCYSRRHAARYYTHEEKRLDERESIFENQSPLFGEELNFKFPLDVSEKKISIATIDEIKKEHAWDLSPSD